MRTQTTRSWPSFLAQGLAVGWAATQALDGLGILLYENEDRRTRRREDRARRGMHAYEVALARAARVGGVRLSRAEVGKWGWRFHRAFGVLGGLTFLALRRRFRWVSAAGGLAFGTAFFLVVDELLMPLTRLTPGPRAFSWKVHARGAVAHLAYGVAAEATARALQAERPRPSAALTE